MSQANQPLDPSKAPHKEILSLRQVRLASKRGHIIIVEAGVPTRIPNALFMEAATNGCVDYNPEMIEAFRNAIESGKTADGGTDPGIDIAGLMKNSVRQVLLAGEDNPELLTAHGVPRVPVVRQAFEALSAAEGLNPEVNVNAGLVEEYFLQVQEEDELAKPVDPTGPVEEDRYPTGDLSGDEVGGVDEDLIDRVTSFDDVN